MQADLGTFKAYTGNSRPCVTLTHSEPWYFQNHGVFRILVYLEHWHILNHIHIRNHGTFRNLVYSEPETYSKPSQASTMKRFVKELKAIIVLTNYNYFDNISFSAFNLKILHSKSEEFSSYLPVKFVNVIMS